MEHQRAYVIGQSVYRGEKLNYVHIVVHHLHRLFYDVCL